MISRPAATQPVISLPSPYPQSLDTPEPRGLPGIAEHGRAARQKASGDAKCTGAEAAIGRFKQMIGDGLRSRTDRRRATEVDVAVRALNHTLELRCPISVRIA